MRQRPPTVNCLDIGCLTNVIMAIVIDDDFATVELLADLLAMNEIKVSGKGYSGKEAVELYKKVHPDVVFLDVMMRDYDGFYGLEKIREIDPDAKVIMIMTDPRSDVEKKLKELKASAILYKPYDIDHLVKTVKHLLKI